MVCKRIFISGKVQGVSFRFHSFEVASQLGLKGWVKNLTDGRLEMLVAGSQQAVDHMIHWVHRGPPQAAVEKVDIIDVHDHIPSELFFISREGNRTGGKSS